MTHDLLLTLARDLHDAGLLAGRSGNLSARLSPDRLLCTPSGVDKSRMSHEDLIVIDLEGHALDPPDARVSSEIQVHLAMYRARPDAGAVLHAHPPVTTAMTLRPDPLSFAITAEGAALGPIARVPYIRPGTRALADACERAARQAPIILMRHHGVTVAGLDLEDAHQRMRSLEHVARILAHTPHPAPCLPDAEVRALRQAYGLDAHAPVHVFDVS